MALYLDLVYPTRLSQEISCFYRMVNDFIKFVALAALLLNSLAIYLSHPLST